MDPPRTESLDPFTRSLSQFTLRGMTAINTMLYRLSDGNVGGEVPNNGKLLLLTTTGRRSGRRMTVPLLYVEADPEIHPAEARRLAIVASKGGEPEHPAWYLNVLANPDVDVHIGADQMPATALPATETEHERFWPILVRQYRYFADYTHRARRDGEREIPVVLLELDRSRATQWRRANM